MRFVLEESSWTWDGQDLDAFVARIEGLLDRLDVARERGEDLSACRALFEQKVHGVELGEILWGANIALEIQQRITGHFNMMRFWDDEEELLGLEATIVGAEQFSPSAVYVHARASRDELIACMPLPGTWSGPCTVVVADRAQIVHFVTDAATHRGFFRSAIAEKKDEHTAEMLAEHAFPDTCFLDGVWRGVRDFAGGYRAVHNELIRFLGILDDHGKWVLTDDTGRLTEDEPGPSDLRKIGVSNDIIKNRFLAWGLDVAPERPNVYADGACRRARERRLGDELLYCELHYKIQLHRNRVHIHRPVKASRDRPIVAIFHEHLPLLGD